MSRGLVWVYKGVGANEVGCNHLFNSLKACLDSSQHIIEFAGPEKFKSKSNLQNASLVAFGGGYTSGFEKALGKEGLVNLRDYVLSGGAYLGLGAGGYFGCDYIEFDKGGPLEKFSERDLRFYPGVGIGPVYPGFKYLTNQGVHTVPVTFASRDLCVDTFFACIDGGGKFEPSNPVKAGTLVTRTDSLACFEGLQGKPAAIVKSRVGKGVVILSGVHLEYDVIAMVDSDPALESLRERFEESVDKQKLAFKGLLKLLNLYVTDN